MRSFHVSGGKLKHKTVPMRKPGPGWALVRVGMGGICNTDVEILRGYHDFRGKPGHEFVGEVAGVRGVSERERARWVGRRVVGEINVACSAYGYRPLCTFYQRKLKTHCARRHVLDTVPHPGACDDVRQTREETGSGAARRGKNEARSRQCRRFVTRRRELCISRGSHRVAERFNLRPTPDRTPRHARSEIHVPWRGAGGDLAHCGEGTQLGWLALRSVRQSARSPSLGQRRPTSPHHPP